MVKISWHHWKWRDLRMSNEPDGTAPYAPVDNVLAVIRRLRDRGLPEALSVPELVRLGIPEGNAGRTLRTLRFLGLVDDEGHCTALFEGLGRASTSEYPEVFGNILREAYEDIFVIVDPADTNPTQLEDAFRHYEPQAQRERMVRLFVGLCREAGLMPGGPRELRMKTKSPPNGRPASKSTSQSHRGNAEHQIQAVPDDQSLKLSANTSPQLGLPWDEPSAARHAIGEGYLLLQGLLRQLPPDREWTRERREQWLKALSAMLDLLITVVEPTNKGQSRHEKELEIVDRPSN
jgi:hypothetical protein